MAAFSDHVITLLQRNSQFEKSEIKLNHEAIAILYEHTLKNQNDQVFVIAGSEDLRVLLPKLELTELGSEAFILIRPYVHSMGLYIRRKSSGLHVFLFDSQNWGWRYYPTRLIIKTINDFMGHEGRLILSGSELQSQSIQRGCLQFSTAFLNYCLKHGKSFFEEFCTDLDSCEPRTSYWQLKEGKLPPSLECLSMKTNANWDQEECQRQLQLLESILGNDYILDGKLDTNRIFRTVASMRGEKLPNVPVYRSFDRVLSLSETETATILEIKAEKYSNCLLFHPVFAPYKISSENARTVFDGLGTVTVEQVAVDGSDRIVLTSERSVCALIQALQDRREELYSGHMRQLAAYDAFLEELQETYELQNELPKIHQFGVGFDQLQWALQSLFANKKSVFVPTLEMLTEQRTISLAQLRAQHITHLAFGFMATTSHQVAVWVENHTSEPIVTVLDSVGERLKDKRKVVLLEFLGLPLDTPIVYRQNDFGFQNDSWSCGVRVLANLALLAEIDLPELREQTSSLPLVPLAKLLFRHARFRSTWESEQGRIRQSYRHLTLELSNHIENHIQTHPPSQAWLQTVADFLQDRLWGNRDRMPRNEQGEQIGRKMEARSDETLLSPSELLEKFQSDHADKPGRFVLAVHAATMTGSLTINRDACLNLAAALQTDIDPYEKDVKGRNTYLLLLNEAIMEAKDKPMLLGSLLSSLINPDQRNHETFGFAGFIKSVFPEETQDRYKKYVQENLRAENAPYTLALLAFNLADTLINLGENKKNTSKQRLLAHEIAHRADCERTSEIKVILTGLGLSETDITRLIGNRIPLQYQLNLLQKLEQNQFMNREDKKPLAELVFFPLLPEQIVLLRYIVSFSSPDEKGNTLLHYAARCNFLEAVDVLLQNRRYLNEVNKRGKSPLLVAIKNGFIDIAEKLIRAGANLSNGNHNDVTLLHWAIEHNQETVVEAMLQQSGVPIDVVNANRETPLIMAIRRGHIDIALKLIYAGANVSKRNAMKDTPLHLAVAKNQETVVDALLQHGAPVRVINSYYDTPLKNAIERQHIKILEKLMAAGADCHRINKDQDSALHWAAQKNLEAVIDCLIKAGMSLDTTNSMGRNPLLVAIIFSHDIIAIKLIVAGADNSKGDNDDNTPLHWAASNNQQTVVNLLLQQTNIPIDATNSTGCTPLQQAIINGHTDIALALINAGADLSWANVLGETPLHLAIRKNLGSLVDFLLQQEGIPLDAINSNGHTPLMEALNQRAENLALRLIEAGANTSLVDNKGNTILHLAISKKLTKVIDHLIQTQAIPLDAINSEGDTPLLIALNQDDRQISTKLIDAGADRSKANNKGDTPLHYVVCDFFETTLFKMLLEKNDSLNAINSDGNTPLMEAVARDHAEMALQLIEAGADISVVDPEDNTLLHLAASNNRTVVITRLLQQGVAINTTNSVGNTPLLVAIILGNQQAAKKLIEAGADISMVDENGNTPLHLAASKNLTVVITLLLQRGVALNATNSEKNTPLLEAIILGNAQAATQLIHAGADISRLNKNGNSPLHLAARLNLPSVVTHLLLKGATLPLLEAIKLGNEELTRYMIEAGADISTSDTDGNTPLHLAVWMNLTSVVTLLLQRGASLELINSAGNTPLLLALNKGHITMVEQLKAAGAKTNPTYLLNDTTLHWAAKWNLLFLLDRLLEQGVSLNVTNSVGDTPLLVALSNANTNLADKLITAGADISISNKQGKTPLLIACSVGVDVSAVKLIQAGANISEVDINGNTALHLAALYNRTLTITHLLKYNPELNATNSEGNTPLLEACKVNATHCALKLIKAGADCSKGNKKSETPLHWAVKCNQISLVDLLIERGASANTINSEGDSPLLIAIKYGRTDIAARLIAAGADISICNVHGDTPLHLAISEKRDNLVELLLEQQGLLINATNSKGQTPLQICFINFQQAHKKIVTMLINAGADITFRNEQGKTLLHLAILYRIHDLIDYLLQQKNLSLNDIDSNKNTALHVALLQNNIDCAKKLIKAGADIFCVNDQGDTPLHLAASNNLVSIVDLLIARGACVNAINSEGETPLMKALNSKHLNKDSQRKLIHAGTDLSIGNKDGDTPLHIAASKNMALTIALLLKRGAQLDATNLAGETPLQTALGKGNAYAVKLLAKAGSNNAMACGASSSRCQFPLVKTLFMPEINDVTSENTPAIAANSLS